jgi:DNA topoisomerase-6 subunit B
MLEMGRGLRKHLEKKKKMGKTREKFELINDIIPAIAEKAASLLELPVPDLAASITKIMSAVIAETTTVWNKETKQTDVNIILYNYTSRARSYTILVTWPEKQGGKMIGNELGGRKEATGVWAWKLETLQPGVQTVITYSLSDIEKGDWNETDVFYRGSQEVIGATKMDEKLLDEIRRQEQAFLNDNAMAEEDASEVAEEDEKEPLSIQEEVVSETEISVETEDNPDTDSGETKQTTLFGGDY